MCINSAVLEDSAFAIPTVIEDIEFIGFINDDSISVGSFHVGLLYVIYVSDKDVVVNETDRMTAAWIDKVS